MMLPSALSLTLVMIADALCDARDPWWIISGAAVALHGLDYAVRDVDVLTGLADARLLVDRLGLDADAVPISPLFRSRLFARWERPPLDVEIMADFHVRTGTGWQRIWPATRIAIPVGGRHVFVPERHELRAMLESFGRPKDRVRAAALAG